MSDSTTVSLLRNRGARRRAGEGSSGNRAGSAAGMLKMYSEETTGIKVDPIVVLVMSLIFIGSVMILHLWGKYVRA